MKKFGYWDFANTVRNKHRYIFHGSAADFIEKVRAASKARGYLLKQGKRLYRAQIGSRVGIRPGGDGIEEEMPLSKRRIIPSPQYVKTSGRANPKGFGYLYLATDERTALAEMRPWMGESLTLATFEIKRPVRLVVCWAREQDLVERLHGKNSAQKRVEGSLWDDLSAAFARPVNREDADRDYIPTQVIAEVFKTEGFDGIAYASGLERGTNVVLFNRRVAKITNRFVYILKKVRYEFEAAPNLGIYRVKDGEGEALYEIPTESPKLNY